jgi:hypothetical protein
MSGHRYSDEAYGDPDEDMADETRPARTPTQEHQDKTDQRIAAMVLFLLVIGLVGVGVAIGSRIHMTDGPRSCPFNGGWIASGDAGGLPPDQYVCTDGTWVHVTGYGG